MAQFRHVSTRVTEDGRIVDVEFVSGEVRHTTHRDLGPITDGNNDTVTTATARPRPAGFANTSVFNDTVTTSTARSHPATARFANTSVFDMATLMNTAIAGVGNRTCTVPSTRTGNTYVPTTPRSGTGDTTVPTTPRFRVHARSSDDRSRSPPQTQWDVECRHADRMVALYLRSDRRLDEIVDDRIEALQNVVDGVREVHENQRTSPFCRGAMSMALLSALKKIDQVMRYAVEVAHEHAVRTNEIDSDPDLDDLIRRYANRRGQNRGAPSEARDLS